MINSDTQIDEALLLRYFEGEVTLSEKEEIENGLSLPKQIKAGQADLLSFFCHKNNGYLKTD